MNFLLVLLFLSVKDLDVSIPYVMSLQREKKKTTYFSYFPAG